jgi:peptidoglycan-associated lipoprotein
VQISGHCDERGSEQYNYNLGLLRANAVKKLLIKYGVKPESISVVSYGETKPLVQGTGESVWKQNRASVFKYENYSQISLGFQTTIVSSSNQYFESNLIG